MNTPRFDAIVFDFDGVLVDSVDVKTRAFAALYEPYGAEVVRKVVAWHLEHGGVSRHKKFRHFHRVFLEQPLSKEEESRLAERFSTLVEEAVIAAAWIPGALEFLESGYARIPFFVASGTPEEELVRIIERRNMKHYFSGVGGAPKGKAEIIAGFLKSHEIAPSRALMVGDSMTDLEAANTARTSFLGVAAATNPFPHGVPTVSELTNLESFLFPSVEARYSYS
jgi:phosphoglycolate phosphatase-like HAD superfamily hydrolase